MIGNSLVDSGGRAQPLFGDELCEQFGVVYDVKVPAQLGVLAANRVEAVRTTRDNLAGLDLLQRCNFVAASSW